MRRGTYVSIVDEFVVIKFKKRIEELQQEVPYTAIVDEEAQEIRFPIIEISEEKLRMLRKQSYEECIPMLFIKYGEKYYYAEVMKKAFYKEIFLSEKCIEHCCSHESEGKEETISCSKIGARKGCCPIFEEEQKVCYHVDTFPFIGTCIETVSTEETIFIVVQCDNYAQRTQRKRMPLENSEGLPRSTWGVRTYLFECPVIVYS